MLGAIISAAGSVAGGLIGQSNARRQERLQREFAQNQLQWKAADAEKAGISKYFAMGAPTASYSPVSAGDMGLSDAGKALGAGIDGQLGKGSTTSGKVSGTTQAIAEAQLDGIRIDNQIKRAELASKLAIATQPGAGGVLATDVTAGPMGAELKKTIPPAGSDANVTYGVSPEVDLYRTKRGFSPIPPQNLSEVHENNAFLRWQWLARNYLLPFMYDEHKVPPRPAPSGMVWQFNPMTGEYVLSKDYGKLGGSDWNSIIRRLSR